MNRLATILKYTSIPFYIFTGLLTPVSMDASIRFEGNRFPPVDITPGKETGLDAVYVLHDLDGVSIIYESTDANSVTWHKFNNLGAAFSEPVENVETRANLSVLKSPEGNSGYIIKDGNKTTYFWVTDYQNHTLEFESLSTASLQDCESTILDFRGKGNAITYFTINGRREVISRDIFLKYFTLEFDSDSKQFQQVEITKNIPYLEAEIAVVPPALCSTKFELSGDRFLRIWGDKKITESAPSSPYSISVYTEAQSSHESFDNDSNIIPTGSNTLGGGSAPVDVRFSAYVSDAVDHMEWQISRDENFSEITHRIFQQDFEYTFLEDGNYYVRFIGSSASGNCEAYGEIYTINIGESLLKIPNIFSPNGDGINDEWKVSYRSLSSFECHIFNRQGHEVFSFNNPDEGWDGKSNGSKVKPGVYFYVIEAIGTDGKRYKKSGDINILDFKDKN